MDLTTSHFIQLIGALLGGILVYALLFILPEKIIVSALILLIPFPFINSRYGSSNMILIYLTILVFILKSRIKWLPIFDSFLLIIFVYLISMSLASSSIFTNNLFYVISIGSNILIFFIVYNFVINIENPQYVITLFVWLNFAIVLYCVFQLCMGLEEYAFMGIKEFSIKQNRGDYRLMGPFNSEITAEYLAMQCILLSYLLLKGQQVVWKKLLLYGLMAANFGLLITTGTRGGLILLAIGWMLFLYFYRSAFNLRSIVIIVVLMPLVFTMLSFLVIKYTKFNLLFERLLNTHIEGGMLDTRTLVWPIAWQAIKQKPVLGHGPYQQRSGEGHPSNPDIIPYPHNLYLFLLYTLGVCGLIAYFVFGLRIYKRLKKGTKIHCQDPFLDGLPLLGIILFVMFLIDQIKIEFLRAYLSNYQQYIFALFATFLASSDMLHKGERESS